MTFHQLSVDTVSSFLCDSFCRLLWLDVYSLGIPSHPGEVVVGSKHFTTHQRSFFSLRKVGLDIDLSSRVIV